MRSVVLLMTMSLTLLYGCATSAPAVSISPSAGTEAAPAASALPSRTDAEAAIVRQVVFEDLKPGQPLLVDNPYGDVRLRFGGYLPRLEWRTVEQHAGAEHPITVRGDSGERFELRARLPTGTALQPSQRVDMTLYVPIGHDVEVITERGLIEARGIQANFNARSESGNLALRGITGRIDVQTGSGHIEAHLEPAQTGSNQRLSTVTGNIVLGVTEQLNAALRLSSSGVFATEFSVVIERRQGEEPNKQGYVEIGKPTSEIEVSSKRGEIRLLRRAEFRPA